MNILWKGKAVEAAFWRPEMGKTGEAISLDTETTIIPEDQSVPEFLLGSAFNGREACFLSRKTLSAFVEAHKGAKIYMHNADFDLAVIGKFTGINLCQIVESGSIVDCSILYRLIGIAREGRPSGKYNLALVTKDLLGEILNKDEDIRCSFGQFFDGNSVDYRGIPATYYRYAALDAIATYHCGVKLETDARRLVPRGRCSFGLLTHDIQLKADIALGTCERLGMHLDLEQVTNVKRALEAQIQEGEATLERLGYRKGKGSQIAYNNIVREIERTHSIAIPLTATGKKSHATEIIEEYRHIEFFDAILNVSSNTKLLNTFVCKMNTPTLRPSFNLIVSTGRTSCREPNLQNLPRKGNIREAFIPPPGHLMLSADYSQLELCTLAQVCFTLYRGSKMRDLLNAGEDLHVNTAAHILNKPIAEISSEERQRAKAVNFGLPGGLGCEGLCDYARTTYGVLMTEEEAVLAKEAYLNLYPEMRRYLEAPNALEMMKNVYDFSDYENRTSHCQEAAAAVFFRIMGGHTETSGSNGRAPRPFTSQELAWAWNVAQRIDFSKKANFSRSIAARRGSKDLQRAIRPLEKVVTLTGRPRNNCMYCQARNTPFQGLAADGAKLALYELVKAGFKVANFIHDEVLIYLPENADHRAEADRVSQIMIDAMHMVVPDVKVKVEYALMRRWTKGAKAVFDSHGTLIPWEPPKENRIVEGTFLDARASV